MRVLVTGANGFAGGHLCSFLKVMGHDVYGAIGPNGKVDVRSGGPDGSAWCGRRFDLTDDAQIEEIVRWSRPERVYHLAATAVTSGHTASHYLRMNAVVTQRLGLEVLRQCGSSRMLFVSSSAVYRAQGGYEPITEQTPLDPRNEYAVSKLTAEHLLWVLARQGLDVRVVRPFNHTGPGQGLGFLCPDLASRLMQALDQGRSHAPVRLRVGRLDSVRDYTDVRDVVRAYVAIMEEFESGEVVNVASGRGTSVREIAECLAQDVADVDDLELVQDDALVRSAEQDVVVGSSRRLTERTGWRAEVPLVETLRDLWAGLSRV